QAVWLRVEQPAPASKQQKEPVEQDEKLDETFVGTIKSIHVENGYGFVECEETHARYDRDVFLHKSHFHNFKVGDAVRFKVTVEKGKPKCRELSAAVAAAKTSVAVAAADEGS
ncbi:unnamed protein product, partial [Polarella glacialis]